MRIYVFFEISESNLFEMFENFGNPLLVLNILVGFYSYLGFFNI